MKMRINNRSIPLCVPCMAGNEWKYIKECLDTNWVSSVGSFVNRFEKAVADTVGTKYAVATVNGTAALHVALLVAGIRPNEEVLVSDLTFIAPANAIRYVGAWPVFMDAEPAYWQMDVQKMKLFLEKECHWRKGRLINKKTHRRVKGILPVHILGHPVDMDPLLTLAKKYNLVVIEDATESLGAKYKSKKVGNLGHVACFSFNGNKIITTGGGGMIVTDNKKWAEKAKYLTTQAKDDEIEYIHKQIGYNYRLTNIQAAMGCAQMEQLDSFIVKKREIAGRYTGLLRGVPGISLMPEAPWAKSIFWLYTILVDEKAYGMGSRTLMKRLSGHRVQTRPLWQPLGRSKAYLKAQSYRIEIADILNKEALSLPSSVHLKRSDMIKIAGLIKDSSKKK